MEIVKIKVTLMGRIVIQKDEKTIYEVDKKSFIELVKDLLHSELSC